MSISWEYQLVVLLLAINLVISDIEYVSNQTSGESLVRDNHELSTNLDSLCENNKNFMLNYMSEKVNISNSTNGPEIINQTELNDYLASIIKKSHRDDLMVEINDLDRKKTGYIEYDDYMRYIFELEPSELENLLMETEMNPEKVHDNDNKISHLYKIEKAKWNYVSSLDTNSTKAALNYEAFYMFKYSAEYPSFHAFELGIIFECFDQKPRDGFLSVEEFDDVISDHDHLLIDPKHKRFRIAIDLNGDNRLDADEFRHWYVENIDPSLDMQVKSELTFLLECCDGNKDGLLDKTDLIRNCQRLVRSKLTSFGFDIDLPKFDSAQNTSSENNQKDEL